MKKLLAVLLVAVLSLSSVSCTTLHKKQQVQADAAVDAVKAGAVTFDVPETVFEAGTKVTAETIRQGAVYERAKTAVAPIAKQFTVYEFNAIKDEAEVQPNGELAVTFRIPNEYSTNVTIIYVADDGTTEKIAATVDATARTVVAKLTHFSTYVLVDLGVESATDDPVVTVPTATEVPTTTTKPATTTTKPATATTKPIIVTTVTYSSFQSHEWVFRTVTQEGERKTCHSYSITFLDNEACIGEGIASPYEEMVPPEYRDQEKPDFTFNGIEWYTGAGDANPITSVTENGNTVTLTDESGHTLVLTRTNEKTAKVVSSTISFEIRAGDVFTTK